MMCNSGFVMGGTNNLWGLREECKNNYWKVFQCCVCSGRSRKIVDVGAQINDTPVIEVAVLPYDKSKPISPTATPEQYSSPPRPIMARQPFSSGSESSGYFTPPAEPHLPDRDLVADEMRQTSGQPERFIKIDTPTRQEENFTVIDSNYPEHLSGSLKSERAFITNGLEKRQFAGSRDLAEFGSKNSVTGSDYVTESYAEENYVEETVGNKLRRDVSLNSLDDLDLVADRAFGEKRNLSKSEADIQIHVDTTRKTVNSAPMLNEVSYADYEVMPGSSKVSLPGSIVDFQEIEVVQEVIKKTPTKTVCKKTITRQTSRRKSCRLTKSESGLLDDSLRPFTKTKEAFQQTMAQLESGEWEVNVKGLEGMVRLIRHHRDIVETHVHAICVALGKHIRNLRSQVARAACGTASEMFKTCKKSLEADLEELAAPLLHRTADTNRFLRGDANLALDVMCTNLSVPRVVSVIASKGGSHQNATVRCAAARLLCAITHRLGSEKFFHLPKDTREKILLSGANMLMEGSLETRKHAKMMISLLSGHSQFHRAFVEAVPSTIMRHIEKSLKALT